MPTKTEAAEALYRTAIGFKDASFAVVATSADDFSRAYVPFLDALDAYSTATPDALPAEVQRVVEAADKYEREWGEMQETSPHATRAGRAIVEAIRAYRSSQPEPLSARLARLGKGARVDSTGRGHCVVEVNLPDRQSLVVDYGYVRGNLFVLPYAQVDAILSESP